MTHEFCVSWNTRTRFSNRHYARYFSTEAEAVGFARKKAAMPLSEGVNIREQEFEDDGQKVTVKVLRMYVPY